MSGEIRISPQQLRAKAEEMAAQNTKLKAEIDSMADTETRLGTMWEGASHNAFHAAFQRDKMQFVNFYNAIQ